MKVLRHWAPEFKFFAQLAELDQELAEQAQAVRVCGSCGGRLHRADYPRAVRGVADVARRPFQRRVSFCCSQRECRKRFTPPSLRFPERKWYTLGVLLVATALGPLNAEHVTGRVAVGGCEIPLRTVRRWQQFFRLEFVLTPVWRWLRARIAALGQVPPGSLLSWVLEQEPLNADHWVGFTLTLLAQAGLACEDTQNEGWITIRRVWHCSALLSTS